jgi:deoxyadenosine/deoxycytidine kinase
MAKIVITIEGNIGSGKSTLTDYIKQNSRYHTIQEFIDESWRDLFYSNRKRYTSYFEKSTLSGRIARHVTSKENDGIFVFDRSLIAGREVFVQNSFDEGYLSFWDLKDYDNVLKNALDNDLGRTKEEYKKWGEKLIVFLDASPKICYERQKKRVKEKSHDGEIIPSDYFKRLDSYYKNFINNLPKVFQKWGLPSYPKLLKIDASRDISRDKNYLRMTLRCIKNELARF